MKYEVSLKNLTSTGALEPGNEGLFSVPDPWHNLDNVYERIDIMRAIIVSGFCCHIFQESNGPRCVI